MGIEVPTNIREDGHEWKYYSYDNNNRHQWYRAMTDAEVREITNRRHSGVDDIPFEILWNVAEYPVYMVELTAPVASGGKWVVDGNRTNLSSPRKGMVSGLGGDYTKEYNEKADAVEGVRAMIERLSE